MDDMFSVHVLRVIKDEGVINEEKYYFIFGEGEDSKLLCKERLADFAADPDLSFTVEDMIQCREQMGDLYE